MYQSTILHHNAGTYDFYIWELDVHFYTNYIELLGPKEATIF